MNTIDFIKKHIHPIPPQIPVINLRLFTDCKILRNWMIQSNNIMLDNPIQNIKLIWLNKNIDIMYPSRTPVHLTQIGN